MEKSRRIIGSSVPKGTNLSSWCRNNAEVVGSMRILEDSDDKRVQMFPKIWILGSIHSY